MIKLSPVLPIPGEGQSRFQPVYIKDWLRCINAVIEKPADYLSTFDIAGPEHLTYREIVEILSGAAGREKLTFKIPMGLMRLSAVFLGAVLSSPPVTVDQLRLLEQDNVCALDAVEKNFGFSPMRFADALKEFIHE
jgi:uncharacterized protein YbjT (DUF2867 family)